MGCVLPREESELMQTFGQPDAVRAALYTRKKQPEGFDIMETPLVLAQIYGSIKEQILRIVRKIQGGQT